MATPRILSNNFLVVSIHMFICVYHSSVGSFLVILKLRKRSILYVISNSMLIAKLDHTLCTLVVIVFVIRKRADLLAVIGTPKYNLVGEYDSIQYRIKLLPDKGQPDEYRMYLIGFTVIL